MSFLWRLRRFLFSMIYFSLRKGCGCPKHHNQNKKGLKGAHRCAGLPCRTIALLMRLMANNTEAPLPFLYCASCLTALCHMCSRHGPVVRQDVTRTVLDFKCVFFHIGGRGWGVLIKLIFSVKDRLDSLNTQGRTVLQNAAYLYP